MAGDNSCPIWDSFVTQRAIILREGEAFIVANNL